MVLLLLLPLFLLSPLSSSAELDLDYPQEKSFSSSIVAPVQELHQLIIGEVWIIFDGTHILKEYTKASPACLHPFDVPLNTNTTNIISRFSRAVARSTNKGGWWTTVLVSQGQQYLTSPFLELSIDRNFLDLNVGRETDHQYLKEANRCWCAGRQ